MNYSLKTLKIERDALKAYNADPDGEPDFFEGGHDTAEIDHIHKDLGPDRREPGFCEKFCSSVTGQNKKRMKKSEVSEEVWKAHIEAMWDKARKYTKRLRFQAKL